MYYHVVMTTGTSVITNFNRVEENDQIVHQIKEANKSLGNLSKKLDDEKTLELQQFKTLYRNYYKEREELTERSSAELSLIYLLHKENKLHKNNVEIKLVYTQTVGGYVAAELVKMLIEENFPFTVKLVATDYIDIKDRRHLNRQLNKYLNVIRDELDGHHPTSTCFAPQGGYKILTALAHLIGTIEKYPVLYTYEGSDVLHTIPPVPIHFDTTPIEQNKNLISKIYYNTFVPLDELSSADKQFVLEDVSLFEIDEDTHVTLSPLTMYICEEKLKHIIQPKVYVDRESYKNIERENKLLILIDEINKLREMHEEILLASSAAEKKRTEQQYAHFLYHTFHGVDINKTDYRLFKSPNKDVVFRALWKYDEKETAYFVTGIETANHDRYKRNVAKELQRAERLTKDDWVDTTELMLE